MTKTARWSLGGGALLAGLGVAAGAFGAHGLEGTVSADRLATWATAAHYHQLHALALVVVGGLDAGGVLRGRAVAWTAGLFAVGIVLFAGSLYALVLLDLPVLGAVTPLGGVAFLAGWGALALAGWRLRRDA